MGEKERVRMEENTMKSSEKVFIVKANKNRISPHYIRYENKVELNASELSIIIHYIRENVELWNEKEGRSYIDKERLALLKKLKAI